MRRKTPLGLGAGPQGDKVKGTLSVPTSFTSSTENVNTQGCAYSQRLINAHPKMDYLLRDGMSLLSEITVHGTWNAHTCSANL